MTLLEYIKSTPIEDMLQWIIIIAIGVIQFIIIKSSLKNQSKSLASFCTSLGIFGTFLGISVGLFYFNPDQINESISGLLGGMKIAFISSVTGLFSYLFIHYKVIDKLHFENAGIGDVVKALTDGNAQLLTGLNKIELNINQLNNTIMGDTEGSLIGQVMLLRFNLNDKFDLLNSSFEKFAKLQAENNTKALITAIREVIGDFNAKINEQFGENFKHLNSAVGDLVTWQDNYKEILDKSYNQFNSAAIAIEKSHQLMEKINSRFNENMKINDDVILSLETLKNENEMLQNKLEAFKDLAENAKESFPIIKNNLEELTGGLSKSVSSTLDSVSDFIQEQDGISKKAINEIQKSTIKTIEGFDTSIEKSNQALIDTSTSLKESMIVSISDITESINNGFSHAINNINQLQEKIGENLENTILKIDDALRQELETSLRSLGNQLATLSQKFVDDYGDLTSKMKTIVHMAES
jgi:DNA anti-recombination protein RmuC